LFQVADELNLPNNTKGYQSFQLSIKFFKVGWLRHLARTKSEFGRLAIAMVTLGGTVAIARLVVLPAWRRMMKCALGSIGVIANSSFWVV
jgi:hypothetical protein